MLIAALVITYTVEYAWLTQSCSAQYTYILLGTVFTGILPVRLTATCTLREDCTIRVDQTNQTQLCYFVCFTIVYNVMLVVLDCLFLALLVMLNIWCFIISKL